MERFFSTNEFFNSKFLLYGIFKVVNESYEQVPAPNLKYLMEYSIITFI